MTLLWRDRLVVGLAPDRLSAIRLGKGFRPHPKHECEISLDAGDSETPWRPGIAAFRELARDARWRTTEVEFVLSSHFVRYAVIPADSSFQTVEESTALGAIVFRKTFGNLCRDWRITLSETRKGAPTLGAAIPSGLLDELGADIGKRCRIHSIRPDLMETFNRVAADLNHEPTIFLLAESGRVTIGRTIDGEWKSIISRLVARDDADVVAHALEEETALCPIPANATFWIRDLTGAAVIPPQLTSRTRVIPAPWPGKTGALLA